MTLIVCVDDRMGMAFNGRRQSRDRAVCRDIARMAFGSAIGMQERTKNLFAGMEVDAVSGETAKDCAYYFLETEPPAAFLPGADRIILYRWNRHYPADLYFDAPLDGYALAETAEFIGSSHEKITREVYVRES